MAVDEGGSATDPSKSTTAPGHCPRLVLGAEVEGELWIGGIGVAKGYLHNPELTKEVKHYSIIISPY